MIKILLKYTKALIFSKTRMLKNIFTKNASRRLGSASQYIHSPSRIETALPRFALLGAGLHPLLPGSRDMTTKSKKANILSKTYDLHTLIKQVYIIYKHKGSYTIRILISIYGVV